MIDPETPRDPRTPAEWQEAVDCAAACLALDSARQYGLIVGGPGINVRRAVDILKRGSRRGYNPIPAGIDRQILAIITEQQPEEAIPMPAPDHYIVVRVSKFRFRLAEWRETALDPSRGPAEAGVIHVHAYELKNGPAYRTLAEAVVDCAQLRGRDEPVTPLKDSTP